MAMPANPASTITTSQSSCGGFCGQSVASPIACGLLSTQTYG